MTRRDMGMHRWQFRAFGCCPRVFEAARCYVKAGPQHLPFHFLQSKDPLSLLEPPPLLCQMS